MSLARIRNLHSEYFDVCTSGLGGGGGSEESPYIEKWIVQSIRLRSLTNL